MRRLNAAVPVRHTLPAHIAHPKSTSTATISHLSQHTVTFPRECDPTPNRFPRLPPPALSLPSCSTSDVPCLLPLPPEITTIAHILRSSMQYRNILTTTPAENESLTSGLAIVRSISGLSQTSIAAAPRHGRSARKWRLVFRFRSGFSSPIRS